MSYDFSNEMFKIAVQLVNETNRSIFLTGKAGTGKTTFLKYIRENCPKQLAVVAPTGVAAINASGVTIHSFFQLPLSPFIPGPHGFSDGHAEVINRDNLVSRLRISKEKLNVLRELELVIIDEISMVRCDTIDAIDTVLRHTRKRPHEKFGGVQMLFIGDMFQLPPVIKEPEWQLLSAHYSGPYFFESTVMKEDPPVYIEFDKIYRQSDERFIRLLNQVRNNELDRESLKILEDRYQPSFRRQVDDGYIILSTHNESARMINSNELGKLGGQSFFYKAEIEGDMAENAYPADQVLHLRIGAQVMFIRNDSDKARRYFNGKLGVVTDLGEDKIVVRCKDDPDEIEVGKEIWQNIRYRLNKTSHTLDEEVLGSFTQFPLRLAWAITIHKSQGLTFDKAIIDAGEAFAAGQVYVALSRCTSLDGMILKSMIRVNSLFTDQRIVEFSKKSTSSGQLERELALAKKDYQRKIILATLDFRDGINNCRELLLFTKQNRSSFSTGTIGWLEGLLNKMDAVEETAAKFRRWVQLEGSQETELNRTLRDRTVKAAGHFVQEIDLITGIIQKSPAVTDSRIHAREYNESLKDIFGGLALKRYLLEATEVILNAEAWHHRKKNFQMPAFAVNAYAGAGQSRSDSPHPILHMQLRKLRDSICSRTDLPIYIVAGSRTIDEMVSYLPQSLEELRKISGFGDAKISRYGQQFLDVIREYCEGQGLSSLIHERSPKRERKKINGDPKPKADTKADSFKLYREGKNISTIARERNLAIQTIEGHLSYYVARGEINIEDLVSAEKLKRILPALAEFSGGPITPIKAKLGNTISFGEIRLALAWRGYKASLEKQ